jgi:hypothetical protein
MELLSHVVMSTIPSSIGLAGHTAGLGHEKKNVKSKKLPKGTNLFLTPSTSPALLSIPMCCIVTLLEAQRLLLSIAESSPLKY